MLAVPRHNPKKISLTSGMQNKYVVMEHLSTFWDLQGKLIEIAVCIWWYLGVALDDGNYFLMMQNLSVVIQGRSFHRRGDVSTSVLRLIIFRFSCKLQQQVNKWNALLLSEIKSEHHWKYYITQCSWFWTLYCGNVACHYHFLIVNPVAIRFPLNVFAVAHQP